MAHIFWIYSHEHSFVNMLSTLCEGTFDVCFQGTYVEGIKEDVVLSPAHCLSLIATGEGDGCL